MSFAELFLLALGLSMDAFAVSVCKGLAIKKPSVPSCLFVGLWFGFFQSLMPYLGFLLGRQFDAYIETIDHWIVFTLLLVIGISMLKEAAKKEGPGDAALSFKVMFPLAIATSIDAFAVGISLAFLRTSLLPAVSFIGSTTFCLSAAGVRIGSYFGARYRSKAEAAGGILLIGIGLKILLEHLGILT